VGVRERVREPARVRVRLPVRQREERRSPMAHPAPAPPRREVRPQVA